MSYHDQRLARRKRDSLRFRLHFAVALGLLRLGARLSTHRGGGHPCGADSTNEVTAAAASFDQPATRLSSGDVAAVRDWLDLRDEEAGDDELHALCCRAWPSQASQTN